MRASRLLWASVSAVLLTSLLFPAAAHAQPCIAVFGIPYPSINAALAAVGPGPGTISVTGICLESVQINNARSITIDGSGGANVVEPTDQDAFDISLSQDIHIMNLDISTTGPDAIGVNISEASDVHIAGCNIHNNQSGGVGVEASALFLRDTTIQYNTPFDGLDVFDNSTVRVVGSTIQFNGSLGTGGTAGVFVGRNSDVFFGGNQMSFVQYNADMGIEDRNLSNVVTGAGGITIQGNGTNGIAVETGAHLQVNSPRTFIQNNGGACPLDPTCGGIFATQDSTVTLDVGMVTGNQGSGVSVQQGANLSVGAGSPALGTATVSNNTGDGIHLQYISTMKINPGNSITGNGGKSVFCDTTSLAVGDLSGFSNVNCAQVARPNGPPRPVRSR